MFTIKVTNTITYFLLSTTFFALVTFGIATVSDHNSLGFAILNDHMKVIQAMLKRVMYFKSLGLAS